MINQGDSKMDDFTEVDTVSLLLLPDVGQSSGQHPASHGYWIPSSRKAHIR